MTQPMPHSTPPTKITKLGPYLSTNQPSIGTSQVWNSTNNVKPPWMEARPHPNSFWMPGTKNVQPYCRLAIITMQITPMTNCAHRFQEGAATPVHSCVVGAIEPDSPPKRLFFYLIDRLSTVIAVALT